MTYPRTMTVDHAPRGGFVVFEDGNLIWAGDNPPDLITDRASDDALAQQIVKLTKEGPTKIGAIKTLRMATGLGLRDAKTLVDEYYGPYDSEPVHLVLTPLQAQTLDRLLGGHITGPDAGPRGILDQIWKKLPRHAPDPLPTMGNKTLYFEEE